MMMMMIKASGIFQNASAANLQKMLNKLNFNDATEQPAKLTVERKQMLTLHHKCCANARDAKGTHRNK